MHTHTSEVELPVQVCCEAQPALLITLWLLRGAELHAHVSFCRHRQQKKKKGGGGKGIWSVVIIPSFSPSPEQSWLTVATAVLAASAMKTGIIVSERCSHTHHTPPTVDG